MKKYKVGLIGIGGFGKKHAEVIKDLTRDGVLECVAFAEPNISSKEETYNDLIKIGARHYVDYTEMLGRHKDIDFVVIATPIHLHREMSIMAMKNGACVLLEKPPAVTIQDLDDIVRTARLTNKLCGVDFQNTSGKAFRLLLDKLCQGILGDIKTVTGVGMWKRTLSYYERTPWAGRLSYNGRYVLDGTVNNPLSHLPNNCLIVAGYGDPLKAMPKEVQAELYRAHDIESEDTSCIRLWTANGVEVRFYATLCNESNDVPYIIVQGSSGKALWKYDNTLVIEDAIGKEEKYAFPQEDLVKNMYFNFIEVLEGRGKLFSSIDSCRSFVLASNGAFESSGRTYKIAPEHLIIQEENGTIATYIKGVKDIFARASSKGKLFSELGLEWAVRTEPFSMEGYKRFELFS